MKAILRDKRKFFFRLLLFVVVRRVFNLLGEHRLVGSVVLTM